MRADALERRVRARLAELESDRLLRVLRPPSGIDLSSNDYLGLSRHPRIISRLVDGVAREGCGSTGSRLLRGEREAFDAVEQRFARFKGTERALYFATGYMANVALLTTLAETGDVIYSDQANHASLIDGIRLSRAARVVFPHNDVAALRRLIDSTPCRGIRFLVVESLFSMDGDMAPLASYSDLCRAAGAVLVVDEAHAVGIYGRTGSGLIEEAGVDPGTCLSIDTAGKALGVAGAFVAGPSWAIEYLVQRARPFVFSTAPPPALADALDASLDVIRDEPDRRARLRQLAAHLRARLDANPGSPARADLHEGSAWRSPSAGRQAVPTQIIPLHVGDNERALLLADRLQALGFDVRAIRPPSVPPGSARLRVSVNAGLTEAVLDRFVDALSITWREAGLCSVASS